jgi:hypothetical protein
MADLAISTITYTSGPKSDPIIAGVDLVAGDAVYQDNTDGKLKKATANTAVGSQLAGYVVNSATTGNPAIVALPGAVVTFNAVLTKGVTYYLSATAGKTAPFADLTSGKYVTLACAALSTTQAQVLSNPLNVTI